LAHKENAAWMEDQNFRSHLNKKLWMKIEIYLQDICGMFLGKQYWKRNTLLQIQWFLQINSLKKEMFSYKNRPKLPRLPKIRKGAS
jgi:hypothetical protein